MSTRHSMEGMQTLQLQIDLATYKFLLERGTGAIFDSHGLWVTYEGFGLIIGKETQTVKNWVKGKEVISHPRKGYYLYRSLSEVIYDEETS